ncbi:MAG: asparaginase [Thermomicrobiales bacterium]
MKPRVAVVTTGGTIACRSDRARGAPTRGGTGPELVGLIPDLGRIAAVEVRELSLVPSWEFTIPYIDRIRHAVTDAFAGGAEGVVVTQGTDTLEETAFWLDLTLDVPALGGPVVVTGAMRNNSEAGADGPRNILDAVTVAAEGRRGYRVPVAVANSQIHAARWVAKTDSFNPNTFQSPGHGPVGVVWGDEAAHSADPEPYPAIPVHNPGKRVMLIRWAAGMDDLFLRACLDAGVDGVVIEGMGLGHIPGKAVPAVAALREREIPVIITTRCQTGPALPVYGGAGGGRDLAAMGCIFGRGLNGARARLMLAAGLGAGMAPDALSALFAGPRGAVTV